MAPAAPNPSTVPRFTPRFCAVQKQRHVLPGVVRGAKKSRIAAVVRGDHQQVPGPQQGQKPAQGAVKIGGRRGVAVDVPPVAVQHVEVHQVHKGQAVKIPLCQFQQLLLALAVARRGKALGDAAARKDVPDFAHGQHVHARLGHPVQQRFARRRQGEVVPTGCAAEILRAGALKGPGDHPAHGVLAGEHLPGRTAVFVQGLHGHHRFVGGHLEHRVRRGVRNQRAGAQVLLPKVPQGLGARVGLVAQHTPAGAPGKGLDQLRGKPVGISGQGTGALHARQLPVADGGILPPGALPQTGKGPDGRRVRRQQMHSVQIEQAQPGQVGAAKLVALHNGAQGVGSRIPEIGGVGRGAHAEGVQHHQKHALCHVHPSFMF